MTIIILIILMCNIMCNNVILIIININNMKYY